MRIAYFVPEQRITSIHSAFSHRAPILSLSDMLVTVSSIAVLTAVTIYKEIVTNVRLADIYPKIYGCAKVVVEGCKRPFRTFY